MQFWNFQPIIYYQNMPYYFPVQTNSDIINIQSYSQISTKVVSQSQTVKQFQREIILPQNNKAQQSVNKKKTVEIQSEKHENQIQKLPISFKNIKANILKDFIRFIKRDSSEVLLAIYRINSQFTIQKFIKCLFEKLPSEGKYFKIQTMKQACTDGERQEFSLILRIIFKIFMRNNYLLKVLSKRKNKFWHLKACRQLQQKLFNEKQ